MPAFFREYGVIIALMIVALSGYFLIGDRRGEIVDYTLDMLGTRLVELASGDDEKAEIARQFAEFSDRVERQEVSPEVVESVAANVLNLRARGAIITPEEAELMLFQEPEIRLPSPADSGRVRTRVYTVHSGPDPVARMDLRELGQRMSVMFELADAYGSRADSSASRLRFSRDGSGIHVLIDPGMTGELEAQGMNVLTEKMREKDWVRWEENLAEQQERNTQLFERQAFRIAQMDSTWKTGLARDQSRRMDAIKRAQKLAMMGATTDLDTLLLNRELESLMRDIELEIEASAGGSANIRTNVVVSTRPDSTES